MRYRSSLWLLAALVAGGCLLSLNRAAASGLIQSAYNLIENGGTPVAREPTLNFVNGGCVDNSGSGRTDCTISGGAGGAGVTIYNGSMTISAAGTTYIPIGGSTQASSTEAVAQNPSPSAAGVTDLYVLAIQPPGTANSVTFVLRKNSTNTALTCTISGAVATSCNDTTHTASLAAGDLVDISVTASGTFVSLSYFIGASTVFGATSTPGVQKYSQSFSTVTSVVLTDNLNTTVKTTQCYDSSSPPNQIIPLNVAITDANDVTVTFSSSQSGSCIVQG